MFFHLLNQNRTWRVKQEYLLQTYRVIPYIPNQLLYRKKMTEDTKQKPCLDKKGVDGEIICKYQQWLQVFKKYTKRKYDPDIGPLIREEAMNGTEWEVKEEKIQTFLRALGAEATHQITRPKY